MLPFPIALKAGVPVGQQIEFAVKRAVVSGLLAPGAPFPSVRQLSQELRINPNTAHKTISALVGEGILVATPGVGTVVAAGRSADPRERAGLLGQDLETVVVEARKLGLSLEEVEKALLNHWRKLGGK